MKNIFLYIQSSKVLFIYCKNFELELGNIVQSFSLLLFSQPVLIINYILKMSFREFRVKMAAWKQESEVIYDEFGRRRLGGRVSLQIGSSLKGGKDGVVWKKLISIHARL